MTKFVVKTGQKTTKSGINYDCFFRPKQKNRISVTIATTGQSRRLLDLDGRYKTSFNQS